MTGMKRNILVLFTILIVCMAVAGCGALPQGTPAAESKAPEQTAEASAITAESAAPSSSAGEKDLDQLKANYDAKLDSYVDLLLSLGVALKEGDELFVEGDIESYEIMNKIALKAYEKGAKFVFLSYKNKFLEHANAKYMKDETYKEYPLLPELTASVASY